MIFTKLVEDWWCGGESTSRLRRWLNRCDRGAGPLRVGTRLRVYQGRHTACCRGNLVRAVDEQSSGEPTGRGDAGGDGDT